MCDDNFALARVENLSKLWPKFRLYDPFMRSGRAQTTRFKQIEVSFCVTSPHRHEHICLDTECVTFGNIGNGHLVFYPTKFATALTNIYSKLMFESCWNMELEQTITNKPYE